MVAPDLTNLIIALYCRLDPSISKREIVIFDRADLLLSGRNQTAEILYAFSLVILFLRRNSENRLFTESLNSDYPRNVEESVSYKVSVTASS